MSSYTDTYGGQNINPALLSYYSLSYSANQTLVWPLEGQIIGTNQAPAADKIDLTPSAGSLSVYMPNATLVSVGQDVMFRNLSAFSTSVVSSTGSAIATLAAGEVWFVFLTSNSTAAGTWAAFKYGAGSSSADAAALAGLGLVAITTTLNQSHPYLAKSSTPYTVVASTDRAQTLVWTSGAGTFNFPAASTLTSGWFTLVKNLGTGTLTLDPSGAETIDGVATLALSPTEAAFVLSDGTSALYTVGLGRDVSSAVSATNVALPASGTLVLGSTTIASQVLTLTGALSGAVILQFGTGAGYWIIHNTSTNAFSVTCQTNGADPGVVVVQNTTTFIVSDGTNMYWADDQLATTGIIVRTAAAARVARTITGTANQLTVTNGSGVAGNPTLSLPSAVIVPGSLETTGAMLVDTTFSVLGAATLGDAAGDAHILNGTLTAQTAARIVLDDSVTTAAAPPLAFDGDLDTGIYRAAANDMALGTNGTERFRIDTNGALMTGAATAATGYTTAGDLTLPAARNVRAKNTAKAWINLNQIPAGGTIRGSYNISSVTDNGPGDYTLTYTNAMSDANYMVALTASQDSGQGWGLANVLTTGTQAAFSTYSTAAVRVYVSNVEVSIQGVDTLYLGAVIFGA